MKQQELQTSEYLLDKKLVLLSVDDVKESRFDFDGEENMAGLGMVLEKEEKIVRDNEESWKMGGVQILGESGDVGELHHFEFGVVPSPKGVCVALSPLQLVTLHLSDITLEFVPSFLPILHSLSYPFQIIQHLVRPYHSRYYVLQNILYSIVHQLL